MQKQILQWSLAVLTTVGFTFAGASVSAELKPGDRLDKSNCQEAKNMLPEHVMEKF